MSYKWERRYPLYISISISILSGMGLWIFDLDPNKIFKDVLLATVNYAAIAVGFLATTLTIFFALSDRDIVLKLKKAKRSKNRSAYDDILNYLLGSVGVSIILTLLCIMGLFFSETTNTLLYRILLILWSFLLFYSILTLYRVIRLITILLK